MAANASMMIGALVAAALCFICCAAVFHDIGAWTVGREEEYKKWAESTVFHPQDTIQFRYTAGVHNVWELGSQEEFDSCNLRDPLSTFNEGSATITLSKPGKHYYVCGVGRHCLDGGMRVAINVVPSDDAQPPFPAESPVPSPPAEGLPLPDAPAPSSDYDSSSAADDSDSSAPAPIGHWFNSPAVSPSGDWSFDDEQQQQQYGEEQALAPAPAPASGGY